jgi:hypothetical protein
VVCQNPIEALQFVSQGTGFSQTGSEEVVSSLGFHIKPGLGQPSTNNPSLNGPLR